MSNFDLVLTPAGASTSITLPTPDELTFIESDMDAPTSGRNMSGTMMRNRVAQKVKLQASWKMLKGANVSSLLNAASNAKFSLRFWNPKTQSTKTITCYCGDRTAKVKLLATNYQVYEQVSVNFIEY